MNKYLRDVNYLLNVKISVNSTLVGVELCVKSSPLRELTRKLQHNYNKKGDVVMRISPDIEHLVSELYFLFGGFP